MLHNCGNSSRLLLRKKLPMGVKYASGLLSKCVATAGEVFAPHPVRPIEGWPLWTKWGRYPFFSCCVHFETLLAAWELKDPHLFDTRMM
ncbi:hypothetical protein GALL_431100 [mine drainage metagenome]|uniref:Uncharacterized protein n=1 Tax=mine drainage metagenome TaxID=410659 RepID=A0A1J5Q5F1_9ZZZZ